MSATTTPIVRANRQTVARRHLGIIGVCALIVVTSAIFAWRSPYFLDLNNLLNILRQQAPTIIIAVASTFVITTKGIDLSVGSLTALTGSAGAVALVATHSAAIAIVLMLAVGGAAGAINGFFVAYQRVPAFIVTLAGLTGYQGVALLITGGGSVPINDPVFAEIGLGRLAGISVPAIMALVVAVVGWFAFTKLRFGMRVVATGSNAVGTRRSGVSTARVIMAVYVLSGLLSAVAGVVIAARLGAGSSNAGQTLALEVVTGVVLGGTSLFGGRGSVIGSALGILLLGIITNGLTLLQMNPFYVPIVQGAILLLALWAQAAVGLQSEGA